MIILHSALLALSSAAADDLHLWDAGFGFAGLSLPDYRGSDDQRGYVVPFPYLVYRDEILKLYRKGLYGILFESRREQLKYQR